MILVEIDFLSLVILHRTKNNNKKYIQTLKEDLYMHSVKYRNSCGFTKFASSFREIVVTSRIFFFFLQKFKFSATFKALYQLKISSFRTENSFKFQPSSERPREETELSLQNCFTVKAAVHIAVCLTFFELFLCVDNST